VRELLETPIISRTLDPSQTVNTIRHAMIDYPSLIVAFPSLRATTRSTSVVASCPPEPASLVASTRTSRRRDIVRFVSILSKRPRSRR
jgi:hypothetical protein